MNQEKEKRPYSLEVADLIEQGWKVRLENFPPEISFDFPNKTLSVSLTGTECSLQCAHCGGHYLKSMMDSNKLNHGLPEKFPYTSALVSGGCTPDGKVPFWDRLELLQELKKSIRLNLHVGLLEPEEVLLIKDLADVVSLDFVGDEATIREVYGLEQTLEDYIRVYRELRRFIPVIPHITLGLRGGLWSGEETALSILEELGLSALVFNVFIPTPGTLYAERTPPKLEEVVAFLAKARVRFPRIPIILGCMRPGGKYRQMLDEAAVELGINRMVMPTPGARRLAESKRLMVKHGEECCAL